MKRILITQRSSKDKYDQDIDYLEKNYISYFTKFNITPILIPNSIKNPTNFFRINNCEGIILTGGEDFNINLKKYSKKNNYKGLCERDILEFKLLSFASNKDIPLLGMCRGMQFINLFFNNKILINKKHSKIRKHLIKTININSKKIKDEYSVNSFHKNVIDNRKLSPVLKPLALSENIYVEAMQHIKKPILGVIWHLERKSYSKELDRYLFLKFLSFIK